MSFRRTKLRYELLASVVTESAGFWTQAAGFVFDPAEIQQPCSLVVLLYTSQGATTARARIFDPTANAALSGSLLTTTSTTPIELTSSVLSFASGRRRYELQLLSDAANVPVFCCNAFLQMT